MLDKIYEIPPFDKALAVPAAAASVVPNYRIAGDISLLGLGYLRPLTTNVEVANSQAQQFPISLIWKTYLIHCQVVQNKGASAPLKKKKV